MIKTIIFDFGGVILDWSKDTTIFSIPHILSKIFEVPIDTAVATWKADTGHIITNKESIDSFLQRMNAIFHTDLPIEYLKKRWVEVSLIKVLHLNADLIQEIEKLKKKYKVYMLSDSVNLPNRQRDVDTLLYSLFDNVFFSHIEGVRKPSKEAFENLLTKVDLQPSECVFIDDVPRNVEAATNLGFHGILYTNFKDLKQKLKELL